MELLFTVQIDVGGIEMYTEVKGNYIPETPGTHTLANGDPGYPPDPAELDITSVTIVEVQGQILQKPWPTLNTAEIAEFQETFSNEIDEGLQEELRSLNSPDEDEFS